LLTYTPVGGKSKLPLTVAVDVLGNCTEQEISRERNALHFDGNSYVKITKKVQLNVVNSRREEIDLLIKANFPGNCSEASDLGKIVISDYPSAEWNHNRGNAALNCISSVDWALKVKPGETRKVDCVYSYFSR
ncbi:MAG: hypothetical protein AB1403_22810, partial [Candidatus Riflebacteria bacterium]